MDSWERYRSHGHARRGHGPRRARRPQGALRPRHHGRAQRDLLLLLATRSDIVDYLPNWLRPFLGFYLLVYAIVALVFFLEAVEALKPRRFRPHLPYPGAGGHDHYPEGLRYHEDIVLRDLEAYRRAWREVRFGQLNAELSVQNHVMARINVDKYRSLRRLYAGLRVLTLLAGGLLAILALSMLFYHPEGLRASPLARGSSGPVATAGASPLGAPVAVSSAGVREASGVAWDASRKRLFVVGDRGTLGGRPVRDRRGHPAPEGEPRGRHRARAERPAGPPRREEGGADRLGPGIGLRDRTLLAGRARGPRPRAGGPQPGVRGDRFGLEPGRPGGGVFHLVHQRKPALLVTLAFDPTGPGRALGRPTCSRATR